MKNSILLILTILLASAGSYAQIDRSKQPEPGPAPKINMERPIEFSLDNGLNVLIVENHKLPRVSISLFFDRTPFLMKEKAGVTSLLGSMLGNGTQTISKDDFNEEIDFLGADLSFGFDGGYASSLSKYFERMLELLADATMNSLLTPEEFEKEKERLLEGLKSQEKSVDAVASIAGGALAYGRNHPYGEFENEATINNVSFEDVQEYYKNFFNPKQAYLVIIGDINPEKVKPIIESRFNSWENGSITEIPMPDAQSNPKALEINFIDMPNAVQSNISLTSNVSLKMNDSDYHAVLIANKILGGGFNSYLNMNLREEHGYTYGAGSSVGADKYITRFKTGASVRNEVTDSAVVQTIKEVKRIQENPVEEEALANAKAKYVGDFVLALERPSTIAQYAINIKANNLPADFYAEYLKKINAVTVEDVQRVANKYFNAENARFIVVGKGSDVIENLEKTGIPINYFDREANAVEKPEFQKPIPAGVTAQSIILDYIDAIGGSKSLSGVKTILTNVDISIQGAPFKPSGVIKTMSPNKESMEMSVEGMGTIMKQKFDGKTGYAEQQGRKTEMTADEIAEKQKEKGLFPETYLSEDAVSLVSLISVNGSDAYKIKVAGKNDSYRYYDATSFMLIRTEVSQEARGQKITQITDISDYRSVNGIQMPHKKVITAGPQIITFDASEIKINEGVSKKDFK
ncbi:MAG: insulinase family protein [Crocinitomicaceae bacterium]|nr:insulinase family protein [Crocinitomicaceae bacterium]